MKEAYLHYAFRKKLWGNKFQTITGQQLEIIDFGEYNGDAGPDFLDAQIRLDGQIWAGPIEFHVNASDWYKHRHQNDLAYQNVIAHFVYKADAEVYANEFSLPTVELKSIVDHNHFKRYQSLIQANGDILCGNQLATLPSHVLEKQKERSLKERLWQKSLVFIRDIETHQGDRLKAYYIGLARVFGGPVNSLPFAQLAEKIERRWLAKLNYDSFQVEALLIGMAGLLPKSSTNKYVNQMIEAYEYQKILFSLPEIIPMGWKYARMRPSGFPDRRLAQFAALLCQDNFIQQFIAKKGEIEPNNGMFEIELNPFWESHFRIDRESSRSMAPGLSSEMVDLIWINVIIPFLYAIGIWEGDNDLKSRSIVLLKQLKHEKNKVVTDWKSLGVKVMSAYDSQSLLALKKQGCSQKKCLFCAVGKSILKR